MGSDRLRILAWSGLVALLLPGGAACTGGSSSSSAQPSFTIGVDLPLSDRDVVDGATTLNGIRFAVKQQNDAGGLSGFHVQLEVRDDTNASTGVHDPARGAANLHHFVSSSKTLGVIGPLNSDVAQAEIPVAGAAGLPLVSPANTETCLTQDSPSCTVHPSSLRPTGRNSYFRLTATDDEQGKAMADYAWQKLHLSRVAVVSDGQTYGNSVGAAFSSQFASDGGHIVDSMNLGSNQSLPALAQRLKSRAPQSVYFAGLTSNACRLRAQLKGMLEATHVPYLGADGIVDSRCLDDAGDQAVNMYASVAIADPSSVPTARSTLDAFHQAFPTANDFGIYTMSGYAAAEVVMHAASKAISANHGKLPSRSQVLGQLASLTTNTPLGPVAFDANGDTTQQVVSLYDVSAASGSASTTTVYICGARNRQACWVYLTQVRFTPS